MHDIINNLNSHDLTLSAIKGTPEKIPFNPFIMHDSTN